MKTVKGFAILLFWSISTLTVAAANYQFDIGSLVFQEHFVALPVLEQNEIVSADWKLPEEVFLGVLIQPPPIDESQSIILFKDYNATPAVFGKQHMKPDFDRLCMYSNDDYNKSKRVNSTDDRHEWPERWAVGWNVVSMKNI